MQVNQLNRLTFQFPHLQKTMNPLLGVKMGAAYTKLKSVLGSGAAQRGNNP